MLEIARTRPFENIDLAASRQLTLRVAKTVAAIEPLREAWSSWQHHPHTDIDFFLTDLRASRRALRPHVMAVFRRGVLDCLLIGKLQRGLAPISAARVPLPPARVLYFETEGFLGNQSVENAEFLVRAIVADLRQGEADVAELKHRHKDSPLYVAAARIPGILSRDHWPVARIHRRLVLPATFHEYFDSLSPKERSNFRTHERLLMKDFAGKIRVHRFSEKEIDSLIRDIEAISENCYQRSLGVGFTPAEVPRLRLEAQNSSLRAYVLYLADQPCAFITASWYKGTLYGRLMGFDPKYRRYSPGLYLLMRFIEDSFHPTSGQKSIAIDPGPGTPQYKRSFTNAESQECSIAIYAPTIKGVYLNLVRSSVLLACELGRAVLVKTGLAARAWKAWRSFRHRAIHA